MCELFQALVGAVLPDYDDYDASLLNSIASHAAHAITRDFNTQGDHQSDCTCGLTPGHRRRNATRIAAVPGQREHDPEREWLPTIQSALLDLTQRPGAGRGGGEATRSKSVECLRPRGIVARWSHHRDL